MQFNMKQKLVILILLLFSVSYLCAEQMILRNIKYDGREDYREETCVVAEARRGENVASVERYVGEVPIAIAKGETNLSQGVKIDSIIAPVKKYRADIKDYLVKTFKKMCLKYWRRAEW